MLVFSVNVQEHEGDVGVRNRISFTKRAYVVSGSFLGLRKFPWSKGADSGENSYPWTVILAKVVCLQRSSIG
jgi:hypothetical protein